MPKPLPLSFFRRPADVVAPELLGCTLIVTQQQFSARAPQRPSAAPQRLTAVITEVEAYLGITDPASHVWQERRTKAVLHLYSPPGTWYVYKSHGLHWCCNLTTRGPDAGHAVLLRGVVVTEPGSLRVVKRRRGGVAERQLTNGPGKLTQALGIDISLDGTLMHRSWATVHPAPRTSHFGPVLATPRIGLTRAVDWPLRWVMK